jgi:hypothetical protein
MDSPDPTRIPRNPAFRKRNKLGAIFCSLVDEATGFVDAGSKVQPLRLGLRNRYFECMLGHIPVLIDNRWKGHWRDEQIR